MDRSTHVYLTQLRIISKIPRNGQLDTTNNDVNIYKPGVANWVMRKFHGDGKAPTATFLTDFFEEIDKKTTDLIKNLRREKSDETKLQQMQLLVSLTEKIYESLAGMNNLMGTYNSFPETVSKLEHIVEDMMYPTLRRCIVFIPLDSQTDAIAEILDADCMRQRSDSEELKERGPPSAMQVIVLDGDGDGDEKKEVPVVLEEQKED